MESALSEEAAGAGCDLFGDDRTGSEQHREDPELVIEAVGDHDPQEDETEPECDRERPVRSQLRLVPQRPPAGGPHRHEQRAHREQGDERVLHRVSESRVLRSEVRVHRERRPRVRRLPEQVGCPAGHRDRDATPQPTAREDCGLPIPHQSDRQPGEEQENGLFRLEPDADGQTHREPQTLGAGAEDAEHQPRHQRPDENVVDRRSLEVAEHQEPGRRNAQARERLCEPRAAELTRHRRREHDHAPDTQRRDQAQTDERVAQRGSVEPRHRNRQRRLVDVPPRKVARRGEEVELVSVISVPGRHHEEHADGDRSDPEDRPGGKPRHQRRRVANRDGPASA